MRGKRFFWFLIMIALGALIGLLYGWVINPRYSTATPDSLRSDYRADYVLMVAEIYQADQNLDEAAARLSVYSAIPPAQFANQAILTARQLDYPPEDLALMDALAQAILASAASPEGQATPTAGAQP
jgi:hypothetical protein